jgi:hypothetical protein
LIDDRLRVVALHVPHRRLDVLAVRVGQVHLPVRHLRRLIRRRRARQPPALGVAAVDAMVLKRLVPTPLRAQVGIEAFRGEQEPRRPRARHPPPPASE